MIHVIHDGEEKRVADTIQIHQYHEIMGNSHETHTVIANEDGMGIDLPDAVTPEVSSYVWEQFGVNIEEHGIEVIDPTTVEVI